MTEFFTIGLAPDPLLWVQHDGWLITLSLLVSMGASAVALHLAGLARSTQDGVTRQVALGSGALALGSGVWTMHYVGMLAFSVCGQAGFDPGITALSVLPSLGASWVALRLLARPRVGWGALLLGGVLVGAGIGAMHYIGMAASELARLMRYELSGFLLSIVVAVVLAVLALWVRFGLERRLPAAWGARQGWVTALAGIVMGLAIAGMHYTGMAALRFVEPIERLERVSYTVPVQTTLALAVAIVTVALSLVVVAVNSRLRYRRLYEDMQRSESRQRAVLETAVDAVVIIGSQGEVRSFNPAAERLLGWAECDIVGRSVELLIPNELRATHAAYQQRFGVTGFAQYLGTGRETQALHRDGRLIPVRLAVGRVDQPGEPLFVGFLTDLTVHKALERAREHDQEQLRSLVANLPGVAFRSRNEGNWPMLFISDAVQGLTGWDREDFMEGRVHWGSFIHPEDAAHIALDVDYALEHAEPYHVEYRITTRSGDTRWISEYGRGVPDEAGRMSQIDGVILDITDARARSAELEGTLTAINRSRAAAQFDVHGHLIAANANYLELLGYTLDDVIGLPHASFCTPEYAQSDAHQQLWARLRDGEFHTEECLRLGKGGREVWMLTTYNPVLDAEGKVSKVLQFVADMTQRRAMEQDLRAAKERAEAAAAARASFLANMSHEIRTPMNAIIGFTEVLLDTPLSSSQQRHLGTVHGAARSLLRLLNDILDTAKLEKGAMVLEVRDFSLRQLCQQTFDTLRINAHQKGLPLVLDYPDGEPDHLRGDALRLQQILLNLLGNAIKFTDAGQVRLQVRYAGSELWLQVQDSGIGMSADQLARLFDPFAQADASTTRRYGGTGLGTTIARQLVELMGGSIAVKSAPGVGTTFDLRLPLPQGQAPRPESLSPPPMALAPLRILAVDDVPANLELLQVALGRDGHHLTLACDGKQAVRYCSEQRFDVVLMDLHMPGMDGLQATCQIRANERVQGLARQPIIALSASVLEDDQGQALEAGMDGFATKPLDVPRLQDEISRVLGLSPAAAPQTHPGASAMSGPKAEDQAPIDWQRALALWGREEPLHQALARLIREHPDLPQELQALSAYPQELAQQAHRLRGAVANMALGPLQTALARLEGAARAQDGAAIETQLAPLPALWSALCQALPVALRPHETSQERQGGEPARLYTAIAQALATLERGELPDAAMAALATQLPAQQLQPLRQALAGFDFDRAQSLLHQLRETLEAA